MSFVSWYWHSGARVSQVKLAPHYTSKSHQHSYRHLAKGHIQLNMLSCTQGTSCFSRGTSRFRRHRWGRSCISRGQQQMLSSRNGSRLCWSSAFLTWLRYCCATLIISAVIISPVLNIRDTSWRTVWKRRTTINPNSWLNKATTVAIAPTRLSSAVTSTGTVEAFTVWVVRWGKINLGFSPSFFGLCFRGDSSWKNPNWSSLYPQET